jgi:hypothetical protein
MTYVAFTPSKAKRLHDAYERAVLLGKTVFWFDGYEYLTDYAKYLLKYLDLKMKGGER